MGLGSAWDGMSSGFVLRGALEGDPSSIGVCRHRECRGCGVCRRRLRRRGCCGGGPWSRTGEDAGRERLRVRLCLLRHPVHPGLLEGEEAGRGRGAAGPADFQERALLVYFAFRSLLWFDVQLELCLEVVALMALMALMAVMALMALREGIRDWAGKDVLLVRDWFPRRRRRSVRRMRRGKAHAPKRLLRGFRVESLALWVRLLGVLWRLGGPERGERHLCRRLRQGKRLVPGRICLRLHDLLVEE